MKKITPKQLSEIYPWSSVLQKSEAETVALNVMKILSRTGNTWRKLTWDEYEKIRINDGATKKDLITDANYNAGSEKKYFEQILPYTVSADTAVLFSSKWKI